MLSSPFVATECDEHHPCQGLGEHAHFRSFGMAFLTLFRIATGELPYKLVNVTFLPHFNGCCSKLIFYHCQPR